MSVVPQQNAAVYTANSGISHIASGAYQSLAVPSTNTLNGPNGPFLLGDFIIVRPAGDLYYLASLTSSAGITSATWTQISTGAIGGVLPVVDGGTGAATLTGVLTGNGTSAITGNAVTNHGVLLGGASNAVSSLAVASTGTVLAGVTGADPAFTGSPSVSGSLTAATTITATLGAITATNGNLVLGTAGNKILSTSVGTTTAAGANSFGSVTLVGGTATVATTSVTASSLIVLWRQSIGATGANPVGLLTVGTITAGVSFVINAATTASASTLVATDVSVVGWMIIN